MRMFYFVVAVMLGILGGLLLTPENPSALSGGSAPKVVSANSQCPVCTDCEKCEPEKVVQVVEKTVKLKLSEAQKASIRKLAQKPVEFWTETDWKNWKYATNDAPIVVKKVEKIVEVIKSCPAVSSSVDTNTSANIHLDMSRRLNLSDRLSNRLDLSDRLSDRGITVKDGRIIVDLSDRLRAPSVRKVRLNE